MRETFEEWKRKVDAEVWRRAGMGADDLDDYPYRDEYEAGATPRGAAGRAIRASMDASGFGAE